MGNNKSLVQRCSPDGSESLPAWLQVVLELSDFQERCTVIALGKKYRAFSQSDKFWRFLTNRLSVERGIYCPPVLLPGDRSWKVVFADLYSSLRDMWVAASEGEEGGEGPAKSQAERFKISVFARFRPVPEVKDKAEAKEQEEEATGTAVVLPLHQRLSMIRMAGKAVSNREALRVLASEGEWFQAKWSGLAAKDRVEGKEDGEGKENASVNTARGRDAFLLDADASVPLRRGEMPLSFVKAKPEKTVARVQSLDPGSGRVVMLAPDVGLREFSFDGVMPLTCTQQRVYDTTTRRLVVDFVNGVNATVVAYGQTASGACF